MAVHSRVNEGFSAIRFYGITQDLKTQKYMMVLEYAKDGNLRTYLRNNFENINWKKKLNYLWELARSLHHIHELNIVHQDLHPGNILLNFNNKYNVCPLS